ncbi:hypothetical protein [Curtobacterium sp. RRHDQ10]|uniref:hypothetical protein n=1 Tax=Curtobacterium phyllosphaerae TaxID=3413379 RepID=UPI003BF3E86C
MTRDVVANWDRVATRDRAAVRARVGTWQCVGAWGCVATWDCEARQDEVVADHPQLDPRVAPLRQVVHQRPEHRPGDGIVPDHGDARRRVPEDRSECCARCADPADEVVEARCQVARADVPEHDGDPDGAGTARARPLAWAAARADAAAAAAADVTDVVDAAAAADAGAAASAAAEKRDCRPSP